MKLLVIIALLLSQQVAGNSSLLKESTRRILAGRFFSPYRSPELPSNIMMPKVSFIGSSLFEDIKKSPESIAEARSIVRASHGNEALEKFNQMLNQ